MNIFILTYSFSSSRHLGFVVSCSRLPKASKRDFKSEKSLNIYSHMKLKLQRTRTFHQCYVQAFLIAKIWDQISRIVKTIKPSHSIHCKTSRCHRRVRIICKLGQHKCEFTSGSGFPGRRSGCLKIPIVIQGDMISKNFTNRDFFIENPRLFSKSKRRAAVPASSRRSVRKSILH